jgi:hypothetical protein
MGAANGFCAYYTQAGISDFTFPDQIFQGSGYIFNGSIGIQAVLVEQVDMVRFVSFKELPDLFIRQIV